LEQNFNTPQRQSAVGIIVMFANTLQRLLRTFWALLIVLIYKMPAVTLIFGFLIVVIVLLIIGIIAYLEYLNFTFFIDQDKQEFVVQHGILNKKRLSVGLDKIQQVNINQSVLQRLIGVYSMDIDTAGSNSKEVNIKAIDHKSAQILKEKLLEKQTEQTQTTQSGERLENTQKEIIKVSVLSLFKIGITSNFGRSFAVFFAFFFTVYDRVKDFLQYEILSEERIERYIKQGTEFSFLILFFMLFFAVFFVNLIRTIIKFYDLKIINHNSLMISFGLFAKRNTLLHPRKAQIVSFSQNFFQRKMNVLKMKIKQASSQEVQDNKKKEKSSPIEIPGITTSEKDTIIQHIYNKIINQQTMFKPNYRFVLQGFYIGILLPVVAFLFFSFFINQELNFFFSFYDFICFSGFSFCIFSIFELSSFCWFGFRNQKKWSLGCGTPNFGIV